MFKIPYIMNRNRQTRGVLQTYNELESPNEGACLRFIMDRNRRMQGCG